MRNLLTIAALFVVSNFFAQNINYNAWVYQFSSWETACNWESGTEEYTRNGYILDNQYWAETSGTCQQCNNNGDCHSNGTWAYQSRTNSTATQVRVRLDAWEDDGGSRCAYGSAWNYGDDCRTSTSTYTTLTTPLEYQWTTNFWNTGDADHRAYARCEYMYTTTSLTNAVDNGTYGFTTGGNRPFWGSLGSWAYSGGDCATSGTITHNQTSSFSTTVSCVSQISFRWNVSSEANYDYLRFYINGVQQSAISGTPGWAYVTYALDPNIDNTVEWRYTKDGSVSSNLDRGFVDQVSYTGYTIPVAGTAFATNQWNVACYNGRSLNLSGVTYRGYYVENNLNVNTTSHWASGSTPSNALSYNGCSVGIDNHTTVHRRQGFPCGQYRIDVANHDDEIRIYVNGAQVYEHIGCCDPHAGVWTGYLSNSSTIEIRTGEGGGGSNTQVNIVDVTTSVAAGTINGAQSVCSGSADPAVLGSSVASSGGAGTLTYQWQMSTAGCGSGWSNIGGATAATYNPGVIAQTTYYRRRATDQCGSVAYTNCITVTYNTSSTAPTMAPMPGTYCPNTTLSLNAGGGTSGTGASIEWYTAANGGGSNLGSGGSINVAPSATTTYYARREGTCGNTSDVSVTVNVKEFIYTSTGASSAASYCTDNDGWHHFYNGSDVIFSINGDLSGAAPGYPQVTINNNGSYHQGRELPGGLNCGSGVANGEERFELPRSWNVDFGGGTLTGTYDVRYYFPASEKTAVEAAAAAHIASYPACGYSFKYANPNGFFWFKNVGSNYTSPDYDGLHLTGAGSSINGVNFSEITGITSFSGGSGGVILVPDPALGALAVEFVSIEGWAIGSSNKLEWQTASLTNSDRFEVERMISEDEGFVVIGEVESPGNSTSLMTFDFIDTKPYPGANYYRVSEIDFDGSVTSTDVVMVEQSSDLDYQLYPNPADDVMTYSFSCDRDEERFVSITDLSGRVVYSKVIGTRSGTNTFTFDVGSLATGTYLFEVKSESGEIVLGEKIVVN